MDISPTMKAACMYALKHGNKLHRAPGGFWVAESDISKVPNCTSFATPTIQALTKRGIMAYTKHQPGRSGKFPVEVKIL